MRTKITLPNQDRGGVKSSGLSWRKTIAAFGISGIAALSFSLGSIPVANAASLSSDNGAGGYASTFTGGDGKPANCIQPGNAGPTTTSTFDPHATNVTVPGNKWGGPVTLSQQQLAQINAVTSTYSASGDAHTRAAAAMVVKQLVSPEWEANSLTVIGYSGKVDLRAEASWIYSGGSADTGQKAVDIWDWAQGIQVGGQGRDGNPGNISGSFAVDNSNNYVGKINLHTDGDTNGVWNVTLTNGQFSNGSKSGSFPANGSQNVSQDVRGIAPADGSPYEISATFTYVAPGQRGAEGWTPAIALTTDVAPSAQWVAGGAGTISSVGGERSASGSAHDPQERSPKFAPIVTTKTNSAYYKGGDQPVDNVTMQLGDISEKDGTVNEWHKRDNGNYETVKVDATLFGPLKQKIVEADQVPANAPVAGKGTFTAGGTTTNPVGQSFKVTSDTKLPDTDDATGFYVWVESIKGSEQEAITNYFLDQGKAYNYSTRFGIADESTIVPPNVATKSMTNTNVTTPIDGSNVPTTGLGLTVKDNIEVTGVSTKDEGFYVIDRYYTFPTTVDKNGDAIVPANVVCDASTLSFTSDKIVTDHAGEYSASFHSDKVGVGTWIETLYSPNNEVLRQGSCSNHNEWAFVKQVLVTTQASSNTPGSAVDTATVWGTIPNGAQLVWNLFCQSGSAAAESDQVIATTKPLGITPGVVNGVTITSPTVSTVGCASNKVYFVESMYDQDMNLVSQGQRGVASESLNTTVPTTTTTTPPTVHTAKPGTPGSVIGASVHTGGTPLGNDLTLWAWTLLAFGALGATAITVVIYRNRKVAESIQ